MSLVFPFFSILRLKMVQDAHKNQAHVFLTYSPNDHHIAHLYDHLLVRQLSLSQTDFRVSANVGSGILKLSIKWQGTKNISKLIKDALSLRYVEGKDIEIEKKLLLIELLETIDKKRFFCQFIQYQAKNLSTLTQKIQKENQVSLSHLKKAVHDLLQNQKIIIGVSSLTKEIEKSFPVKKEVTMGKIITLPKKIKEKSQDSCLAYHEYCVRVPIRNIFEAHQAEVFGKIWLEQFGKLAKEKGLTYKPRGRAYKDYNKHFFLSINFTHLPNDETIALKSLNDSLNFAQTPEKKLFLKNKGNTVKTLEKNAENWELRELNRAWQTLEWGETEYLTEKEEIEMFNQFSLEKFRDWSERTVLSATRHHFIITP